jgi:hypothetical protein
MNSYTYTDKIKNEVVFKCVAENITAADELYNAATKQNIVKQVWIGCSIEFGVNDEKLHSSDSVNVNDSFASNAENASR